MSLEISMCENSDIRTEIGELRAKYEDLVVQCERLVDENEQLRTYKEHLTEELDRIAVLCEQGRQGIQEIFSVTSVAPDDMTPPV